VAHFSERYTRTPQKNSNGSQFFFFFDSFVWFINSLFKENFNLSIFIFDFQNSETPKAAVISCDTQLTQQCAARISRLDSSVC
jgi:hypothetical protein